MPPNIPDHTEVRCRHHLADTTHESVSDAASSSEAIIRWLPLLAANDFLDEDNLPPVA